MAKTEDVKAKVTEWLNTLVNALKTIKENEYLEVGEFECSHYGSITGRGMPAIQCREIREIAKIMDLEVQKRSRNDDEYPIEYSIIYDGVMFYSLSDDPWVK